MISHYYFLTFFAWQYSFSITFPSTQGLLDAPDAREKNIFNILDKQLQVPGYYIIFALKVEFLFSVQINKQTLSKIRFKCNILVALRIII